MTREITGYDKFVFPTDVGFTTVSTEERAISNAVYDEMTKKPVNLTVNTYEDAKEIITELIAGNNVLVNFENLDLEGTKTTIRRVLDYVGGAVYALGGKIQQINYLTFLFISK